jgi:erythromycin esterase-like protein
MPDLDSHHSLIATLERHAQSLQDTGEDYRPLIDAAKNKKFVLLGEASHGTAEFYRIRAEITQHLIIEEGFDAVAVEADWPDAYRVNRFVSGTSDDMDADAALSNFERFPTWMWRNTEVLAFVAWLRDHNRGSEKYKGRKELVGFYGLDLYSMTTSMAAVLTYLDKIDPQ